MTKSTWAGLLIVLIAEGCSGGAPQVPSGPSPLPTQSQPPTAAPADGRVISAISPTTGGTSGATLVRIEGSGLSGTTSVTFGGLPATRVGWSPDGTVVYATTPPGAPGPADVVVRSSGGAESRLVRGFTYGPATPLSATGISPSTGSTAGGTFLTIRGDGFQAGARVTFDGGAAFVLYQTLGTAIGLTTGPHAAGPVDVVITNPDGQIFTIAGGYTYARPQFADFNGEWEGSVGHEQEGALRFTVKDNVLVSVSCGPATGGFSPAGFSPASTSGGEFVIPGPGSGAGMTGGLVSAGHAEGTIGLAGCTSYETVWSAERR